MAEKALDYQFVVHEEYPHFVAVQSSTLHNAALGIARGSYIYYCKRQEHKTETARLPDFHYSFFNKGDWPLTLFLVTSCYIHPAPLPLVLQQRGDLDAVVNALKKLQASARRPPDTKRMLSTKGGSVRGWIKSGLPSVG